MEHWNKDKKNSEVKSQGENNCQKLTFESVITCFYLLQYAGSNSIEEICDEGESGDVRVKMRNPFLESVRGKKGVCSIEDMKEYVLDKKEPMEQKRKAMSKFCKKTQFVDEFEDFKRTQRRRIYKFLDVLLDEKESKKKFEDGLSDEQFDELIFMLDGWESEGFDDMCRGEYECLDSELISDMLECFITNDSEKLERLKELWEDRIEGIDSVVYKRRKEAKLKELISLNVELMQLMKKYAGIEPEIKKERSRQLQVLNGFQSLFIELSEFIMKEAMEMEGDNCIKQEEREACEVVWEEVRKEIKKRMRG